MAVTIDWVLFPHLQKEDGTNFIRLRITHKRKSKYVKTSIAVVPEDLTRSGNLKNQGKEDLAEAEVKKWRNIVDTMPTYSHDEMDVGEVVGYIKARIIEREAFRLDFVEFGKKIAQEKKKSARTAYMTAMNALARFFGHNPDISEITVRALRGFEEYLRKKPLLRYVRKTGELKESKTPRNENTIILYLSTVRAVYNQARLEFNDPDLGIMRIPVDIFEYYTMPKGVPAEHYNIPVEWVQMMIDQRQGLKKRERLAIDAFLLSFALMGINAGDMYKTSEKAKDGVIHYFRSKTTDKKEDRAEMYVRIEPCISQLMKEYAGKDRLFDFSERYTSKESFNCALNEGLKQWKERNGLKDERFTFYAARHTWATLGASKQVGVDFALITEGLCHSDASRKMDMVYIRKDWERVWDANAKVLSLLTWR